MVGEARFELATTCTQNRCATGLRHSPISSKHGRIRTFGQMQPREPPSTSAAVGSLRFDHFTTCLKSSGLGGNRTHIALRRVIYSHLNSPHCSTSPKFTFLHIPKNVRNTPRRRLLQEKREQGKIQSPALAFHYKSTISMPLCMTPDLRQRKACYLRRIRIEFPVRMNTKD